MAIKTGSQIERDFFKMITGDDLGSTIKGKVYRDRMRPSDAETEDIVIKFLSGLDEQVQTGVVILNIYVPDIPKGKNGRKVPDLTRIDALEAAVRKFIDENTDTEYDIESDGTPQTYYNEEIEQNLIAARSKFKRITA